MLLLYAALAVISFAAVIYADDFARLGDPAQAEDSNVIRVQGAIMGAVSVPLIFVFALGLLTPRKRWGWIYGFVPIAIGLTSPCCLPASIPLLLFWLKPATKRWFNMG